MNQHDEIEVISENENWYEIKHQKDTGFILKRIIHHTPTSFNNNLSGKTIVIDPGHGGYDVGAISINGHFEKTINYKTAIMLKEKLTLLGAETILTRQNDSYLGLANRASVSNLNDTDVFISIHYNSYPEIPTLEGIGSYYYDTSNKQLANDIQKETIMGMDALDRGVSVEDFQVLRQNFKPSLLVELGFISNQTTENLIMKNAYQQRLVFGIINGLNHYFNRENKLNGSFD